MRQRLVGQIPDGPGGVGPDFRFDQGSGLRQVNPHAVVIMVICDLPGVEQTL